MDTHALEVLDTCAAHLLLRKETQPHEGWVPAVIHVNKAEITLGRSADVKLDMPTRQFMISRRHAQLLFSADQHALHIRDLGSSNGTLVDTRRIGQDPVPLRDGSVVVFGGAANVEVGHVSPDPLSTLVYYVRMPPRPATATATASAASTPTASATPSASASSQTLAPASRANGDGDSPALSWRHTPPAEWTVRQVAQWLQSDALPASVRAFEKQIAAMQMTGRVLLSLTEKDVGELGQQWPAAARKELLEAVRALAPSHSPAPVKSRALRPPPSLLPPLPPTTSPAAPAPAPAAPSSAGKVKKVQLPSDSESSDSKRARLSSKGRGGAGKRKWAVGAGVEAKCQNANAEELNAWFDASVLGYDPATDTYRVCYDGYTEEEVLPADCLRKRSKGEWKWRSVQRGDVVLACYKNGWWYDAEVLQKLNEPANEDDPAQCLEVKFFDLPKRITAQHRITKMRLPYADVFIPNQPAA